MYSHGTVFLYRHGVVFLYWDGTVLLDGRGHPCSNHGGWRTAPLSNPLAFVATALPSGTPRSREAESGRREVAALAAAGARAAIADPPN